MNTQPSRSKQSSLVEAVQFLSLPRQDRLGLMDEAWSRVERATLAASTEPANEVRTTQVMLSLQLLDLTTEIMSKSDEIDRMHLTYLRSGKKVNQSLVQSGTRPQKGNYL